MTNTWPTEEEIIAVLRDGTPRQIAEMHVRTACTDKRLGKRVSHDRRTLTHDELIK